MAMTAIREDSDNIRYRARYINELLEEAERLHMDLEVRIAYLRARARDERWNQQELGTLEVGLMKVERLLQRAWDIGSENLGMNRKVKG